MRLSENSVPKTNPDEGTLYGREDEPEFAATTSFFAKKLSAVSAKALLVFEGDLPAFHEAAASPRTIAVVFDGDSLPLFSMPDGVSCVIAAGSEKLLCAARYFSEVRGISCTLFPVDCGLDGAFEKRAKVKLNGEDLFVTLSPCEVLLDAELLSPTLCDGYMRTLLARLAEIEGQALALFRGGKVPSWEAEIPTDLSLREIVLANARQRKKESCGALTGEGIVLADLLKKSGEKFPMWQAFFQLTALYSAFFEKGKPRRYFTPDYADRARKAETVYPVPSLPTPEEYALRALTLERVRGILAKQLLSLRRDEEIVKNVSLLSGEPMRRAASNLQPLSILPERCPYSLSAIIRDFGLMECI